MGNNRWFILSAFLYCGLAATLTLPVSLVSGDAVLRVNSLLGPAIHCNNGDSIVFSLDSSLSSSPFYITTTEVLGLTTPYAQFTPQGATSGTVTLNCDTGAFTGKYLYYHSTTVGGGKICFGDNYCDAPICTDDQCWGEKVDNSTGTATATDVVNWIKTFEGDYVWYLINVAGGITDFSFSGSFTYDATQDYWKAPFQIVSSLTSATITDRVLGSIRTNAGISPGWLWIALSSSSGSGLIYVATPKDTSFPLGGYVDILFFEDYKSSSPTCNIHDPSEFEYNNLVGEYSGDGKNPHVREGTCFQGWDSWWQYMSVSVNSDRTGGSYKLRCDSTCRICDYSGTFKGDDCTCNSRSTDSYDYCFSVKFAGVNLLVPSFLSVLFFIFVLFF